MLARVDRDRRASAPPGRGRWNTARPTRTASSSPSKRSTRHCAWSNGRRFEIVFADDSGGGVRASAIAQQFVDSTRIVAVVGHVNSGAMVAAAHVYDKHLAAVATTATSPSLTGISPLGVSRDPERLGERHDDRRVREHSSAQARRGAL